MSDEPKPKPPRGIRCPRPQCGGPTFVYASRAQDGQVTRYRACTRCDRRCTTVEKVRECH